MNPSHPRHPSLRAPLGILLVLGMAGAPVLAQETKDSPIVAALKSLKLSAYAQILGAEWDPGVDSFSVRRARFKLTGELVKNLRFKVAVDVAKSPALLDGIVEYEPSKAFGVRIGQFILPFSLENTTPTSDVDTVNRSLTEETLAPGRDNSASGRDVGAAVFGRIAILEYALGFFNGQGINKADANSHKDFSGRVVLRPVKFLAVGGSLYRGKQNPEPDAPLVRRDKEGLEAALLVSTLSLKSEYIHAKDDLTSRAGWYVQGGWFALPGRLQAIVKYDSLDLDSSIPGDGKRITTFGVNWFITGLTKLQVNYEIHRLEGGGREKSGLLAQVQAGF
jgi:phosphate-selective porin OprO and OprP